MKARTSLPRWVVVLLLLLATPLARDAIRKGGLNIRYLDYDWALNATKR